MRELTLGQRATRPLINWLVEAFFPNGVYFYGNGALSAFDRMDVEKAKGTGASAALYLIRVAHENGSYEMDVTADGVTINGEMIGDWEVIVRQSSQDDEGNGG